MCYEDRYDDGDDDADSSDFDGEVDGGEHCDSAVDHPTTTSSAAVVLAEDAYLQRSTVDADGAVDIDGHGGYEDEYDDSGDGDESTTLSRPVLLQWPLPYSKRMQLVKGSRFNGFYFPPPPLTSASLIVRNDSTSVEECKNSLTKKPQDNRWLCVYAEN